MKFFLNTLKIFVIYLIHAAHNVDPNKELIPTFMARRLENKLKRISDENVTKYAKYIVYIGFHTDYYVLSSYGVIIRDDLILTTYCADMPYNERTEKGHLVYGFIVPGNKRLTMNIEHKLVQYSMVVSINNHEGMIHDNISQFTLILLTKKLKLNADVNVIPISYKPTGPGDICIVMGWGNFFRYSHLVAREIEILRCEYTEVFCIDLLDENEIINNCNQFHGGEPVICNDKLVGVVNYILHCNESMTRSASSVYYNQDWLKYKTTVFIKSITDSSNINQNGFKEIFYIYIYIFVCKHFFIFYIL